MQKKRALYRPDIDGLRGIAVLMVVLHHAGFACSGGYVGVDIFFAISGYLITGIIIGELEGGSFSFPGFWERRIRRIYPALLVVVVATTVAGALLLLPEDFALYGKSMASLYLLCANMSFWKEAGYFDVAAEEKPLLHTWSLAVEEQFYLLMPFVLLLLVRWKDARWAGRALGMTGLFSLGLSTYELHRNPQTSFYLMPLRAWELVMGALLAMHPPKNDRGTSADGWFSVMGMLFILVPCFAYGRETPFPGLSAVPPVLGTALLIRGGAVCDSLPFFNHLLTHRLLVAVGLISYSLYLWHWPILAIARHVSVDPLSGTFKMVLVASAVALATFSWRWIEMPVRRRRFLQTRKTLFLVAVVTSVTLVGVGWVIWKNNGFDQRLSDEGRLLTATAEMSRGSVFELRSSDIPGKLVHMGRSNAAPEILVWGDSHAMAVFPAITALCDERGVCCEAATHSSTAPVIGYFRKSKYGLNDEAVPFNDAIMRYAISGKFRAVILVAAWNEYLQDEAFSRALKRTVEELGGSGVKVFVMKEVPIFDFSVPRVLARLAWNHRDLSQVSMTGSQYEVQNCRFDQLAATLSAQRASILEPVPLLMKRTHTSTIQPYDSGGSFYFDSQHLSTYGALSIKMLFSDAFASQRVSGKAG